MALNKVFIDGHLGADPEIRITNDKKRVANFSIANTESYKKGDDWIDKTTWIRVTVWGEGSVKRIEKHARKGVYINLLGKLVSRTWSDRSGEEQTTLELVVNFMDGGQIIQIAPKSATREPGDEG